MVFPHTGLNRTSVGLKHEEKVTRDLLERGLNRTSVGLKLHLIADLVDVDVAPQSNQRGIETMLMQVGVSQDTLASIEPAWD